MRRALAFAAFLAATSALALACNLLSGVDSLAIAPAPPEGAFEAGLVDGSLTTDAPSDSSPVDSAIVPSADGGYACSGDSCFDAGACEAGPCPVRLFANGVTGSVRSITADTAGVYWSMPDAHRVVRLLNPGPSGMTSGARPDALVVVPDGMPTAIGSYGGEVFWTESDSGRVRRISETSSAGTPPTATLAGQGAVDTLGIGVLGTSLAWGNGAGQVTSGPLTLQSSSIIASGQSPIVGVGHYAGVSFWASSGSIAAIRYANDNQLRPLTLASVKDVRALAVDANRLYWASGSDGLVESMSRAGGGRVTVSGEGEPTALAIDATSIYWVNIADGRVRTVLITNGNMSPAPTTLASGQSRPRAIAVAGDVVYWVNETNGEVWALHGVQRGP